MAVTSTRTISKNTVEIRTPGFKLVADTNAKLGGHDLGPNPHEYLEAALAGCTAITLQMYATRKQIQLEDINVSITITSEGESNAILREITLTGDLTAEHRRSLMTIADKCPIHLFLERGATITTQERKA